MNKLTWY